MLKSSAARTMLSCLLVVVALTGLFGNTGFVYAADRTVVAELWSADN